MIKRSARICSHSALLLLGLLAAVSFDDAQSSPAPPNRENIVLNPDVFTRPEYVEALAKELEKESVAAFKNQEIDKQLSKNPQNDVDSESGRAKKFYHQRKEDSPSDTVIYPAQLFEMSNKKRNFDEIDHSSGFSGFNKRNFDEIDRTGFSSFNRKRNFDEIDRSGFSGFNKRNFDEIDRTGFSGFNKKRNFDEIDRTGFSGFNRKRNFDEIDRTGFSSFNKRNFDEIDRSGIPGFAVRSVVASSSKLVNQQRH